MKHWAAMFLLALAAHAANAADLFVDRKLRPIKQGDAISSSDTVGNFALYPGESKWTFEDGKTDISVGPAVIPFGYVRLVHKEGNAFVAGLEVWATLNLSASSLGYQLNSCDDTVLYSKRGRADYAETCVTARVAQNNGGPLYFHVRAIAASRNGALLDQRVTVPADIVGFRNSSIQDWTEIGLKSKPRRKAFVERLTAWSEAFMAATASAFQGSTAAQAYKNVPSYLSLVPIPDDLRDTDHGYNFFGAIEHLKDEEGFKAIAFSPLGPRRTRWSFVTKQDNQEDADRQALTNCERERPASRPPCQLYSLR